MSTFVVFRKQFKHLTLADKLRVAAVALLVVIGLGLIAEGLIIKAKAAVGQALIDRAFMEAVVSGEPVKPWDWADSTPVARIEVPRLNRATMVLDGANGETLAWGAGLVSGTALPGDRGASVLAAHRDTHFSYLRNLHAGDEIRVTRADGRGFTFVMDDARVVRWDASGIASDPQATPRLYLTTCWPFDAVSSGPWRYVIEARMLSAPAPAVADEAI